MGSHSGIMVSGSNSSAYFMQSYNNNGQNYATLLSGASGPNNAFDPPNGARTFSNILASGTMSSNPTGAWLQGKVDQWNSMNVPYNWSCSNCNTFASWMWNQLGMPPANTGLREKGAGECK
jgi:hypothetical protein